MSNKRKNIIITLTLIILIGIAWYSYSQKNTKDNLNLSDTNLISGDTLDSEIEEDKQDSVTEKTTPNDAKALAEKEKANNYKIAFDSGRKAYLNKDYSKAIAFYKEALSFSKTDIVYADLYSIYSAQGNWPEAMSAINSAIEINPSYTDYWFWKITTMNSSLGSTFSEMRAVYEDGLNKVNKTTKINLVTSFAVVAEKKSEISYAVSYWELAKTLSPENKEIFQKEIDRLKANN